MRFISLIMSLTFVLWSTTTTVADSPKSAIGIVKAKPAEGPSVQVADGYMVAYTLTIPGTDVSIEMIPVPGAKFKMGSPADEDNRRDDEGPQIDVVVDPMWVAKTEINWAQYKEYMKLYQIFKEFEYRRIRPVTNENKVDAITAPTELYDPSFTYEHGEDPMQPAVTMTQYAAQQYTKWLSLVTGQQYRLPTEAEWEYSARAGTKSAYSFGNGTDNLDDYAWYFDNSADGPAHVGSKLPNAFGLHDMHGGVAEWTVNQYHENGYVDFVERQPINATDAVQWPKKSSPCVVRGGSWEMNPPSLRSAARFASDDEKWKVEDPCFPRSPWWFTSAPSKGVGFRLFRSYQPLPKDKITKFWEANAKDVAFDVDARIQGGRGGLGLVDPSLPAAIKQLQDK